MSRRIVVTSGKGGVGKTTVTASIGISIAETGKRVVLVDADIGLNNLDVVLAIENKIVYDILDVISGKCKLKQALIQDVNVPTLFVLPSAKICDSPLITAQSFRNVVHALSLSYDYVIIDCPAGIDNGFHRAVSSADEAVVVTTPAVSSIRDADKVLSLLSSYQLNSVGLVVNRVRGDMVMRGEMMSAGDISRIVRTAPIGVIPEDDCITMYSAVGRVPFDTQSGRAFKMLATNIISGSNYIFDCNQRRGVLERLKSFLGY
ncbi:MAG: septum site-determining protein MinD [Clostridia bacterium]